MPMQNVSVTLEEEEGSGEWILQPIAGNTITSVNADYFSAPATSTAILHSNLLLKTKLFVKTFKNKKILLPYLYQDLQQSLAQVPQVDSLLRKPTAQSHNINDLQKLFAALVSIDKKGLTDKQQMAIEETKLCIMHIAQYDLDETVLQEEATTKRSWLRKGLAVVLIMLGLAFSGAESFTGATDLFSGLLKLAEPISFSIAISFAALSTLLFVALEAKGFMVETGIASPINITKTVKSAKQQLDVAKTLNQSLRFPAPALLKFAELDRYKSHAGLNKLIQLDIIQKNTMLARARNSSSRLLNVIKRVFSFSGASLFACAGVVVGKDLVANIALLSFGVALSGPAGIAVIITLAIAGFALFYALQHRAVFDLFDSLAGRPKELLREQNEFIEDIENTDKNIATNMRNVVLEQQVAAHADSATPSVTDALEAVNSIVTTKIDARAESPSLYSTSSSALFHNPHPADLLAAEKAEAALTPLSSYVA
jgi:hypothetical protein